MIREIIKEDFLLCQKSADASIEDKDVIQDMLDTMNAYPDICVGMAANMIGVLKRIIIIKDNNKKVIMLNPVILKTSGRYFEAEENCLCHDKANKAKRFEKIKVQYQDQFGKLKMKTYTGLTAQIIQHEIDHCNGILI